MQFEIRHASRTDSSAAKALRIKMLRDEPHAFGDRLEDVLAWPEERWRVRASSMLMPDSVWVAAVGDDGTWLGQMAAREYGPDAWLLEVYLVPELRGSGAAAGLLAAVQQWAAARGLAQLFLDVNERSGPARRFYAREGFVETGKVSRHPLFHGDREFEMVKRLRTSGPGG
jgi:GNAT superfamily N-acetyltransferase